MAEIEEKQLGNFRTVIGGFHKADVLNYIDAMQTREAQELQERDQQLVQLRQSLSEQQKTCADLQQQLSELVEQATSIRDENDQLKKEISDNSRLLTNYHRLQQEIDICRLEKQELLARQKDMKASAQTIADLKRQLDELSTANDQLMAERESTLQREQQDGQAAAVATQENERLTAQLEKTTAELNALRDTNRRYDSLVGDVGSFIMELHSMGQRFLETAYKRSDACLQSVETSVSALYEQLVDARTNVGQARQQLLDHGTLAGLKLDELVQQLEESADGLSRCTQEKTNDK